ncbi:di/tricarboxylate transporter [Tepidamorphus gemmatus]|uniref:Di/tricarboxylate transporter n=1 Tax=Tepidamorphus gemmatus TaxID=747076 RepID=A0A4R3LYU4_9HYPH|nr:SLC13 family permease [Tepidamorphus gemmatus]TCT05880.1 di/tricarboxylate transporter [Tepidamorphus gemmatus]
MNVDQIVVFAIFFGVFALLIYGRWRYDLVALGALFTGLLAGVVPVSKAFAGFGHPATMIVAMVLVVSRGLMNSGAVHHIARLVADGTQSVSRHILLLGGVGAALSTVMNNVAALAMLMPVDIESAHKAGRSPAVSLMPLSFATILGGMVTMIGTPPNIIIAQFSRDAGGTAFGFFSFAPVGLACAIAGLVFIALIGWRLIPKQRAAVNSPQALLDMKGYTAEVVVGEESPIVGKMMPELDEVAAEAGVVVAGLVRRGKRLAGRARRAKVRAGDILVLEASPAAIDRFVGSLKLGYIGEDRHRREAGADLSLSEVVVPRGSRLDGRSADEARLLSSYGITLLGISRQGKPSRERVRRIPIQGGDVLLLLGPPDRLAEVSARLGTLTLADRGLTVTRHGRAWLAVGLFAAAVVLASTGLVPLAVALIGVVVAYAVTDIVPPRQLYESIDWPVVVLLGALIPLGTALEETGGTALLASGLVGLSAGFPAWVAVMILLAATMSLSDVLNNNATALVAAPVAIEVARALDARPDAFLMAVAVGASCAFLTPIGHQNNTLVMGPGGYSFGDYWRMGLPLELMVVAVGLPAILIVWPL